MTSLKYHEKILKEEIFFLNEKWPHFDILFKGIKKIAKLSKKNQKKILFLERTNLYGGISLFAPYFKKENFLSIDCITDKLLKRGAYNKKFLNNNKLIKIKSTYQYHYTKLKIKKNFFDFVVVPNLMHHIADYEILFKQIKSFLKPRGYIFIFEPLVRELHQVPEDYIRFTPFGLSEILKKYGFKNEKIEFTGGPFSCMAYYLDQGMQYIPLNERVNFQKKFNFEYKKLILLDKKYKKNLVRKNTSSPMAFTILSKLHV